MEKIDFKYITTAHLLTKFKKYKRESITSTDEFQEIELSIFTHYGIVTGSVVNFDFISLENNISISKNNGFMTDYLTLDALKNTTDYVKNISDKEEILNYSERIFIKNVTITFFSDLKNKVHVDSLVLFTDQITSLSLAPIKSDDEI